MNVVEVMRELYGLGDVFSVREVRERLGVSRRALHYYLGILVDAGLIVRVAKGLYAVSPWPGARTAPHEFVVGQLLVPYGAIAYWSALSHYGLTEQIPMTVFLQIPRRRGYSRFLEVGGRRYKLVSVSPGKFFGNAVVRVGRRDVRMTSPEKTVVDCLDMPRHCGGIVEVFKALRNARLDYAKLIEYAERMPSWTVLKRLGFAGEALGLGIEREIRLPERARRSFALLDPTLPARGGFSRRWGLRVNVPRDYWEELE